MKRVLIAGGTGFIGRHLVDELRDNGWQVTVLTRDARRAHAVLPHAVAAHESLDTVPVPDAVVNLAGEDIAGKRWTRRQKHRLLESRLRVTRALVNAIRHWPRRPGVMISGSAVGYYGACGEALIDESHPPGDEFQSRLCAAWEDAALRVEAFGVRLCRIRTGLVLDAEEGALASMIGPFKAGLGGPIGDGRQYLPWIHVRDAVRAIRFLVDHPECSGALNLVAPSPVTNRKFVDMLAGVLHRPTLGWVPAPLLKLAVGERSRLMLTGQRVIPQALQNAGFEFAHATLESALTQLLVKKPPRNAG